jgi:hypothetical protein
MSLRFTQPLTEKSTRDKARAARKSDNISAVSEPIV